MYSKPILVTALFDLGNYENNKKRLDLDWYLKNCEFTLSQECPMFIFTEPLLLEKIQNIRKKLSSAFTCYETYEISELKYFKDMGTFINETEFHKFKGDNETKLTKNYMMLMWNKFEFINKVYQKFQDEYDIFSWIDVGVGAHIRDKKIKVQDVLKYANVNTYECTIINPIIPRELDLSVYYDSWKFRLCGNFWSIGKNIVNIFVNFLRTEILTILDKKYIGPDEEIMGKFTYFHPELCTFKFGDYGSSIINRAVIKYDINIVNKAVHKAHVNSLHGIASSGFKEILKSISLKYVESSIENIYLYLYKWSIETYYIDKIESSKIFNYILEFTNYHPLFCKIVKQKNIELINLGSFFNLVPEIPYYQKSEYISICEKLKEYLQSHSIEWLNYQGVIELEKSDGDEFFTSLKNNFHHFVNLQIIIEKYDNNFVGSYFMHHNLKYEPALSFKTKTII